MSNISTIESKNIHSFEMAKQFEKEFVVEDYNAVINQLNRNAKLTSKGEEILRKIRNK